LYLDATGGREGRAFQQDAAHLLHGVHIRPGTVDLIITSPPYLQVVNYGTSNWIRLWLLGLDEVARERGAGRQLLNAALDHRHTYDRYRAFMKPILDGIRRALRPDGVAAVIIGDVAKPGEEPVPLATRIWAELGEQCGLRLISAIQDDLAVRNKVSRIWGETKGMATAREGVLVISRADEHPIPNETIDWDEPYKDAGRTQPTPD
jgi:site-specific DNA-methyltransferase (adenine-specific)